MATKEDVILVNIVNSIVQSMVVPEGIGPLNYEPGRGLQIMKSINDFDNSISSKGEKYPLIALVLPVRERRGLGYYATVTIPRIIIATMTKSGDGVEPVLPRFAEGGNFPTVLYPLYYEFLRQCARSKNVIGGDPDAFEHERMDNPGQQPIGQGSTDFIDSIEILNLKLILNQIKLC